MKLGDVMRDRVSGFIGVATSRTEWLNGCVRWGLSPQKLHEGKVIDSFHFDQEQLEVVRAPKVAFLRRFTGGDRPAPVGRADPR
jgi:hypothetical protein